MEKKNIKRLFLAVLLGFLLVGNWAATEYFAAKLGYQPLLGSPIFSLGERPIYLPWDFWVWFIKFYEDAPKVFAMGFSIIGICFGAGIVIVAMLRRVLIKKPLTSCGTAHWASRKDIEEAKLLDGKGVFLGKTEDGYYLRDNDNRHALVVAPTRSGKGVGLVVPTGLSWTESIVFIDIKGEIYSITSGYRKNTLHQTVIKFDPTSDEGSAGFNPLDEIRLYTNDEIKDTINIVHAIARPDGSDKPDHWRDLAASMIEGVVLHLKYIQDGDASFGDVLGYVFGEIPIRQRLQDMAITVHGKNDEQRKFLQEAYGAEDGVHPFVKQKAYTFLQKEDKEFAGIMSTVEELLKDFSDPILAKNTSFSSFHIRDLMYAQPPISLYLIVPPSDLERMAKFFRLIVVLIYQRLTEHMAFEDGRPAPDYNHKLLLLLDEFPALGRIVEFEKSLGYIAGYGLRAFIIIQGLNQLFAQHMYGRNTSIIDNCHIRVFHTPNDDQTPEYMSKMMGKETIEVRNRTFHNDLLQFLGENSYNVQEKGKDLMTAAQISELDSEAEIIFVAGRAPIKCRKIRYFQDSNFMKRLQAEVSTDSLYELEERKARKLEICAALAELDADKTEKARYLRQLKEKMEEIAEAEYIAKSEAAIAKFKDKQQEAMNAEIDAALGMQLAGDGTNEEAAKDASENEDDEAKEEPVDDSPLDETAQPDGFMDITSETFMEGQDDFEVDF